MTRKKRYSITFAIPNEEWKKLMAERPQTNDNKETTEGPK